MDSFFVYIYGFIPVLMKLAHSIFKTRETSLSIFDFENFVQGPFNAGHFSYWGGNRVENTIA